MSGNSISDILTKLNALENTKRRDFWDKLGAIGLPALLTAIVGVATVYQTGKLNEQTAALEMQRAELNELKTQLDFTVSSEQLKIRRAETIKQFFDELAHQDVLRKKLAIESVRMVLSSDDAARLIGVLEKDGEDETVKTYAREASRKIQRSSISGLYSDRASERKAAYNALIERWGKDPALVEDLIEEYDRLKNPEARDVTKSGFENGVYNTLVLLSHMDPSVLREKSEVIEAFTKRLTDIGKKTQERKDTLLERVKKAQ